MALLLAVGDSSVALAQSPDAETNDQRPTRRFTALSSESSNDPCLVRHPASTVRVVESPPSPEIRIADVRFERATKLPLSEQNAIASKMMDVVENEDKTWVEGMVARVGRAWQEHGFFKAQVKAESRELSSSPEQKIVALTFTVDEGQQYRMGAIRFLHRTQFTDEQLTSMFTISRGDIFNVSLISNGLESIRKLYGEAGFINMALVPETSIDEQNAEVSLNLDLDEGKQFHISQVQLLGVDEKRLKELLREYKLAPGEIYSERHEQDLVRDPNFPAEYDIHRVVNAKNSTVCLVIQLPEKR